MPVIDQGLRQARVVIGKTFLEPDPVRRLDRSESGHQPVGEEMPDFPGAEILRSDRAIGIQPEQREAQARGERKASTVGSASANSAAAQRRRDGLASLRAHSPSAHSVRP